MSAIDNALQALFVNGCKVKKLWMNASPTSQFTAQKINLTLSNYGAVLAEFKTSTAISASEYCRICFEDNEDWTDTLANTNLDEVVEIRTRQYAVSSTGVQFQQGYGKSITNAGTSVRNDYAIPLTIYGIQLLGGAIANLFRHLFKRRCAVCL